MGLDDLATDRQTEAQADVAGREERDAGFLCRIGCKPGAVVLHLDLEPLQTVATGFRMQPNADSRIGRVRLEGIEHYLGQRMFEGRAGAGHADRPATGVEGDSS